LNTLIETVAFVIFMILLGIVALIISPIFIGGLICKLVTKSSNNINIYD